jgi:hypothetical protein
MEQACLECVKKQFHFGRHRRRLELNDRVEPLAEMSSVQGVNVRAQ